MRALNTAATGMLAQQTNVEVIADNIANVNTTGYKRARAEFQDLLYQSQQRVGGATRNAEALSPAGVQIGLGVRTAGIARIYTQGSVISTGNSLDLAIQGRGFLAVQIPGQEALAYTRAGNLSKSATGEIVTAQGYVVQPGIVIPDSATDVTIAQNGEVYAYLGNQTQPQLLGQLDLALFVNENGLRHAGENLVYPTEASGEPVPGVAGDIEAGYGTVLQGFVESSNVNVIEEITSLITAQRGYEMNSKVIQAADEMLGTTSNLR
jgi:flagellar basal-body rod protein FlgG